MDSFFLGCGGSHALRSCSWLITGCSTGLGRALGEAVIAAGHNAVVTARDAAKVADLGEGKADRVLLLTLEVTDDAQVTEAVGQAPGEVLQRILSGGAGFGAVDNEGESWVGWEVHHLKAEVEVSHDRVVNVFEPAAMKAHVLRRPSSGKFLAPGGQLADKIREATVVRILAGLGAQGGDDVVRPGQSRKNVRARGSRKTNRATFTGLAWSR
jgi:NAD(P)-dependent dehydrogenase (short-subunit alcohol dehydrogenase family)